MLRSTMQQPPIRDDSMPDAHCRICDNSTWKQTVIAEEMMIGLRHRFSYGECACCGAVQRLDDPGDMAPYYPANSYYSFARRPQGLVGFAHGLRAKSYFGRSLVGRYLANRYRRCDLPAVASVT